MTWFIFATVARHMDIIGAYINDLPGAIALHRNLSNCVEWRVSMRLGMIYFVSD